MTYGYDDLDPTNDTISKQDLEVRAHELRDRSDMWNSGDMSEEDREAEKDTEAYEAGPLDRVEDSELFEIEQLLDEISWSDDDMLINADFFPQYARQLAEDINGDIYNDWPNHHIDWDRAAQDLEQDYTSVDYHGQEFFIR